jgi:chemotaxis-related protein WspD
VTSLPIRPAQGDCWNTIGVRGDRSCPELTQVVHCQNCPVFAAAGRRFLDAPSPPGYLEEWTERLAAPVEEAAADLESVLVFRLADEWLALPVAVLVEVTTPRPVHRVPFRAGLLAGLVNIRGELYLCAHLVKLLGIEPRAGERRAAVLPAPARDGHGQRRLPAGPLPQERRPTPVEAGRPAPVPTRLLVVRREADRWVFPADAVEKVVRVPRGAIGPPPATIGRAVAHLSRGVFDWEGRSVGLLDDARLFEALRARLR